MRWQLIGQINHNYIVVDKQELYVLNSFQCFTILLIRLWQQHTKRGAFANFTI